MRLPDSPGARFGIWTAGAVVALLVLFVVIDRLTPTPEGPRSSSYATSADGAAAYAELLEAAGHRVTRLRRPLVGRQARGPTARSGEQIAQSRPPDAALRLECL